MFVSGVLKVAELILDTETLVAGRHQKHLQTIRSQKLPQFSNQRVIKLMN